ncbi:MAG: DUF4118 domain-containing protein [Pseudorhodoplanes sp.]
MTLRQTLLTLAMVTAVTALIYAVDEFVDLRHEIVFYFVPVLFAMLRWNIGQAIVAIAASIFFANLYFYEQILNYYSVNPKRVIGLCFLIAAVMVIGYLAAALRSLRRRTSVPSIPLSTSVETAAPAPVVESKAAETEAVAVARNPTVPERVRDFLLTNNDAMYCDSCIQEHLGLKWRQQVQLITATLGVTREFRRDLACCSGCNEEKQATQATA